METRETALLACLLALLVGAVLVGAGVRHAHADSGYYEPTTRDMTNWVSAERMRHAKDVEHAAQRTEALASLRAAAETREEEAADAPQEAWDAQGGTQAAWGGSQYQEDGFRSAGVLYGADGTRFTWYSQRALPGGGLAELNANGRHVDERGYVVDADGYIALASGAHSVGEVVETPVGTGKVYDYCPTPGTIDVYTDF